MSAKYLLLLLILLSCQRTTPNTMLAQATEQLQTQCTQACETGQSAQTLLLPNSTRIYSTQEAICTMRNNALFCARCPCDIMPQEILNTTAQGTVTCTMQRDGAIQVRCT